MSDIGDLFGNYATPFKKKILQQLADSRENKSAKPAARHITKNCSDCDSEQAWYSSDHGATWQCFSCKRS